MADQSGHDKFHMLPEILSAVGSMSCASRRFAGDFPRLLVNPSESRGREAGFFVHNGVSSALVPFQFAAVQESSSEDVVGLPQRCAKVSALFDDLLRILWDTARLIHPRQTPMHRRRPQPRWWTGECFRALQAYSTE